jgi:predicted MPP superfamily phosphohydrolase
MFAVHEVPIRPLPQVSERDLIAALEHRLGRLHARQRLGMEIDRERRASGRGLNFFHLENWYSVPSIISAVLWVTGLYRRAHRNAENIELRHHRVHSRTLPPAFDGFTILQISDPHVDMNPGAMRRLGEMLRGLSCDICVLTGDYRGRTVGPFEATLAGLARLRAEIASPVYAVLGNHDTVRMVPGLESMGIRVLLNECETISRGEQRIYLAGVDDASYYRLDNLEKAAAPIPPGAFAVLLSHTPEIYRQAAHAGFALMLSGHTHGGQICLPGGVPVAVVAKLPRRFGAGAWRYHEMAGYTSVGAGSCIVSARLNCPPEVTLHHLVRCMAPSAGGAKLEA